MVSTYELFQSGMLDDLIKKGLISKHIATCCGIYKDYLFHKDCGKKYYDAVGLLADKYCMTERSIQRAIKRAAT